MQETYGLEITMTDWMKLGVPVSACMLVVAWFFLTKVVYPVNFKSSSETQITPIICSATWDQCQKMSSESCLFFFLLHFYGCLEV